MCVVRGYFVCVLFFFLMIRRPPRSTQSRSSAASDVYKRQAQGQVGLANQRAETQTREGQADTRAQTESVIEQARRQAAELMQGIQARYGGTVSYTHLTLPTIYSV